MNVCEHVHKKLKFLIIVIAHDFNHSVHVTVLPSRTTFDPFTTAIPPAALQDLAWHRTDYLPSSFVGIHWYVVKFHSTLGWFLRPGTGTGCFLVFALGFVVGFRAKLSPMIMTRMIFAYTGIHFYRSTRYFWMKQFCIHIKAQKFGKIAKIGSKMLYFLQYTGLNQNLRFVTANKFQ